MYLFTFSHLNSQFYKAVHGLIWALMAFQTLMAVFLVYWLSKAVCRMSFNTLVSRFLIHSY